MLGPYYRPQLTSVLSMMHRITGVVLTLVGVPLLAWWLIALGQGPEAYAYLQNCMGGLLGRLALLGVNFSLSFHLLNGIRHLVWDSGRALELRAVYASGWLVLAGTVVLTGALGVVLQ